MKRRFIKSRYRSRTQFVLSISVVLMLAAHLFSLDPRKTLSQNVHEIWELEDGLPQSSITDILQTRDGFLWVATEEGLARYDGIDFEIFDKKNVAALKNDAVYAMLEDPDGVLWLGTDGGGLVRMALEDGRYSYKSYTTEQGLVDDHIWSLAPGDDGTLWVGTINGLSRFDSKKETFTSYAGTRWFASNFISSLMTDRAGDLWIGTRKGLYRMNTGAGKIILFADGHRLSGDYVTGMAQDRQGNLWFGTADSLYRVDPNSSHIETFGPGNGLTGKFFTTIVQDRDGSLWFGDYNGNVNRLVLPAAKDAKLMFTTFYIHSGARDAVIWSIYEDREGSLWMGTDGAGLHCFKDAKFVSYTAKEGLANEMVWCTLQDRDGYMWLGTNGGWINRLDPKTGEIKTYGKKQGLSGAAVWSACEDHRGNIWFGTDDSGLHSFDKATGKFTTYTTRQGLSNNRVSAVYPDRDGNLWVGTYGGGIDRFRDGKFVNFNKKQGLTSNYVQYITVDRQGNLWVGTEVDGVNRIRGLSGDGAVTVDVFNSANGLENNEVTAIYEDNKGFIWFGTYGGGLTRYDPGTGSLKTITMENGLFNNIVYRILEDDRGFFWMSCNKGIFRVSKQELTEFCGGLRETVNCTSYDETDGMASRECRGSVQPAGWKDRDGKLWFPTLKGVVMVDPRNIRVNRQPPLVVIRELVVDNRRTPLMRGGNENRFTPRLQAGSERYEIHYSGLSFLVPKAVKYRYKLEGYEKEWQEVGTRRTAYYSKLPPNNYTFRVTACNNDGYWNEEGASFSFFVNPHFYQTWWFYLLAVLAVILLIGGYFRYRVRSITRRKLELERLVEERTRQLEASNKELEMLSMVATKIDNAVIIVDAEGNLVWVNETFEKMGGMPLDEFIATRGRNILKASFNPRMKEMLEVCLEEKKPIVYENKAQRKSGETYWFQATLTPVFDKQGELRNMIVVSSDITALKEFQLQIQEQNKEMQQKSLELQNAIGIAKMERETANAANRAKSDFLARMSHEIRTPMNGILGFADLLEDTRLNKEQQEYVRTITRSGETLTALLNDILDFSKIEAGELTMSPIDFEPRLVVKDVLEIVSPRVGDKAVELESRIDPGVPEVVYGDSVRFRQVLVNLMGNAVKFTHEGEVALTMDATGIGDGLLRFHVTVRDTGIGIQADMMDSIFDAFQQADGSTTRQFGGSGLGLAICKQIAQLMGGDVRAESTQGNGSVFHFTAILKKSLPSTAGPDRSAPVPADLTTGEAVKTVHILLAEDNPVNQRLARFILTRAGHKVSMADNGQEAVDMFTAEPGTFDMIFMDVQMPVMNGYEATGIIRGHSPDVPIIAMTAQSMKGDREKCLEAGMDDYLSKPIKRELVLSIVQKWAK